MNTEEQFQQGEIINLKVVYKRPLTFEKKPTKKIPGMHVVHVHAHEIRISPGMELMVDDSVISKLKKQDIK